MYILIVSRGYPTEKYIMNGIFEFDQAKALVQSGHKVIYAAIDMRSIKRTRKWGFESFKKDGVQIEAINIPCGRLPKKILSKLTERAFANLYKKIRRKYGEPDIIHAHFIGSGYIIAKKFNASEIPLVLTEHFSAMNQNQLNSYFFNLGYFTYSRMDKVIAVSKHLANNITDKFGVKPIVIPNIVDITCFKYNDSVKKIDVFNIVSTGSLFPNKRMDMLIEAFYMAFSGNEKVYLYIFGEGPERNKLEKLIYDYGLKEKIILMGLVDRKEIAKRMNESDCFVLASQLETFGVAFIEAMAMGLPVIATKCGGPEDFINEKNGVLVPVDSIVALSKALKDMYNNINHYDKLEISNSIKKEFEPIAIASKLTEVYQELLKTSSQGID